uniref:Uncharacterized protein n=1 Tax=Myotis myotis TaxID=51298 RepID=A0A7J7YF86_MYOMY|nr:hypothetical protein mMyoMyo1_011123 [Myotis myotis]
MSVGSGGNLNFYCRGLAPLVGFAHAQWQLTEAPAVCLPGRCTHTIRVALALKPQDRVVCGQVSRKEEFRISIAGEVLPCFDKSMRSRGSQGIQEPPLWPWAQKACSLEKHDYRVQSSAAVEWEGSFCCYALGWIRMHPVAAHRGTLRPFARVVHSETPLR